MGDDSINTVISHIDMGYLVILGPTSAADRVSIRSDLFILLTPVARGAAGNQGLTLLHFSAQPELFRTQHAPHSPPNTP
jgi:hypothetical protein